MPGEDLDPEKLEETAESLAWTLNDESWEAAPPHRKEFWREIARETIEAMLLPQAEKTIALKKVQDRIEREGLV